MVTIGFATTTESNMFKRKTVLKNGSACNMWLLVQTKQQKRRLNMMEAAFRNKFFIKKSESNVEKFNDILIKMCVVDTNTTTDMAATADMQTTAEGNEIYR